MAVENATIALNCHVRKLARVEVRGNVSNKARLLTVDTAASRHLCERSLLDM